MADQNQSLIETVPTQLFIGGEWVDASGGATFEVRNPATGDVLTSIADCTPADGERALADSSARQLSRSFARDTIKQLPPEARPQPTWRC